MPAPTAPPASRSAAETREELFDQKFLENLRSLFFKLRKRRQLNKKGEQQTPATGFTREFKDHRQYTPGDDYRAIDWRLYARLEKLFIRLFEEVQEFHVHLLVDTSTSMADPFPAKRVAALRLAAALAYLGLINGHRVSLMSMGTSVERELPPLKGQGHIHDLLKHLATLDFDTTTELGPCFAGFRPTRDRRGIVFVISDLFGHDPEESAAAIRQSAQWPAETHVIHVLEPRELHPDLEGELLLTDVETGEERRMWLTQRDMDTYTRTVEGFIADVKDACMRSRANYVTWRTDHSFEDLFMTLLSRGSALAKG